MNKDLFKRIVSIGMRELSLVHGHSTDQSDDLENIKEYFGNDCDICRILDFSASTGLSGLFLSALKRIKSKTDVEQYARDLYLRFPSIRARELTDMILFRELETLNSTLSKKSTCCILKGPVFARELYGKSGQRNHLDLDILVDPKDQDQVEESLLSTGYELLHHAEAENTDEYHHILFGKQVPAGITIIVEIHFRLKNNRFGGVRLEWIDVQKHLTKVKRPFTHTRMDNDGLFAHILLEAFEDGGSFRHLMDLIAFSYRFNHGTKHQSTIDEWQLRRASTYFTFIHDFANSTNEESRRPFSAILIPPWYLFDPSVSLSLRLLAGHYIVGGLFMAIRYVFWWGMYPPRAVFARRIKKEPTSIIVNVLYIFSPLVSIYVMMKKAGSGK